jgi:aminoglycoside phosphotransferase family enzyme/gluconate kinase
MQNPLIESLLNPNVYPFPVDKVELVETHISWVLLTGSIAFKIKKPMDFGFLDFSTLEKRRYFCEEEVRLNSRFAPEIYQQVIAITGSADAPQLDGEGEVLEYAVQMQQFDVDKTLDMVAVEQGLDSELITNIARGLALFHRSLETEPVPEPPAGEHAYGSPEIVWAAVKQNFDQVRPLLCHDDAIAKLDDIENWATTEYDRLELLIRARRATGFVRDCHGDMHLKNMALYRGEVLFFDSIEFNPGFRVIDIASELAFLIMDLQARKLAPQANRLLNTYLHYSGDYAGLALLRFYCSYRAMVRAKVALLQVAGLSPVEIAEHPNYKEFTAYLELAGRYSEQPKRFLALTCGVSGTGKSTLAAELASRSGAIQVRSDIERKRLFGLEPEERSDNSIYTAEASHKTFTRLEELAEEIIHAGYPCIVDATFIKRSRRKQFREQAEKLAIPFFVLDCQASTAVIEKRIESREAAGNDASEATVEVMREQLKAFEGPEDSELANWIAVDTIGDQALDNIVERLQREAP